MKISKYRIIYRLVLLVITLIFAVPGASAFNPDRYAASSKMASGKWVKIKVEQTGMQLITLQQLKAWGFDDPSKVNVYGYGGRMISETLDESHPDDLTMQPVVRTSKGIVFYGVSNVSWLPQSGNMKYARTINPYSNESYYFVSDASVDESEMPVSEIAIAGVGSENVVQSFTERLIHEKQLAAPANTGRLVLGEDFRSSSNQRFQFDLTGNTGDAKVSIFFGSDIRNGSGKLKLTANGVKLNESNSDAIGSITSGETFVTMTNTVKSVEKAGDKLDLMVNFSSSGALQLARLDYITVEYDRRLQLDGKQLVFYDVVKDNEPKSFIINGVTAATQIWNVTDPSAPKLVNYELEGSKASFTIFEEGYYEFAAFDAEKFASTTVAGAGTVANQDIHSMPVPDMLIISPKEYEAAARRIATMHETNDGMRVYVITPSDLYNEFSSGTNDVSAFRKALKMWYDRGEEEGHSMRYCLMFGRPTYDNLGLNSNIPIVPIWQSEKGYSHGTSYSTDDFIAMLADGSGSSNGLTPYKVDVSIGRMPVKSVAEANTMVDKLERYVNNPTYGIWRNSVAIIADDENKGSHMLQSENMLDEMKKLDGGRHLMYERIYLDAYQRSSSATGTTVPAAAAQFKKKLNEGLMFISYIGHANPRQWSHEQFFTWQDIVSMSNRHLPFLYTASCEFARWDADEVSGAEEMWLNPSSGVIAMIATNRTVYIDPNGEMSRYIGQWAFNQTEHGNVRIGDILRLAKNSTMGSDNRLRFLLMGDPALMLPRPGNNIVVDNIGDTGMSDPEVENPVLGARGKVDITGRVVDNDGNTIEDFDGIAEIVLYDAEQVVKTNGYGDGIEYMYNDRKTKLFQGRVKVNSGQWKATVTIPAEIQNNYSPAMLSIYSYSNDGREANGSEDRLYIYGFAENIAEDNEGPIIGSLVLNSSSFTDGDVVSPSPIVLASFMDESGINISEASIGHNMTIAIDDKIPLSDVSTYYVPNDENAFAGSIAYPLSGIGPGEHKLYFTVWDNAGNSSTAEIAFKVAINAAPIIKELTTNVNPATTSVTFMLSHDRPEEAMECKLEVFDLGGKLVWSDVTNRQTGYDSWVTFNWDLKNNGGVRVPRGIYLYRATVTSPSGPSTSQTKKLAVTTAQ